MAYEIILASKSRARKKILERENIKFEAIASNIDETSVKQEMLGEGSTFEEVSEKLAQEKALNLASFYPDHIIIGGDQLLVCENKLFSKAKSIEEASENLKFLKGKDHTLVTSVAVVFNKKVNWTYTTKPSMRMIDFTDDFLQKYLEETGEKILESVGCYFIEEDGKQLFSNIDKDEDAIMGLPFSKLKERLQFLESAAHE